MNRPPEQYNFLEKETCVALCKMPLKSVPWPLHPPASVFFISMKKVGAG
jgi:hypothetical protein